MEIDVSKIPTRKLSRYAYELYSKISHILLARNIKRNELETYLHGKCATAENSPSHRWFRLVVNSKPS